MWSRCNRCRRQVLWDATARVWRERRTPAKGPHCTNGQGHDVPADTAGKTRPQRPPPRPRKPRR